MYWQPARHPRAGMAVGIAILTAWLGAIGIAVATDDSVDGKVQHGGAQAVDSAGVR